MSSDLPSASARHGDRMREQLAQEAARWISHEASSQSLITVTRAALYAKNTRARVYVSIFPESETRAALAFLTRERQGFADHLKQRTKLRPLPHVDFLLDDGSVGYQDTAPLVG